MSYFVSIISGVEDIFLLVVFKFFQDKPKVQNISKLYKSPI